MECRGRRAEPVEALSALYPSPSTLLFRAGNGTRTRDPNLGKVVLYQLSYSRKLPIQIVLAGVTERPSPIEHEEPGMEARGIEPLTS